MQSGSVSRTQTRLNRLTFSLLLEGVGGDRKFSEAALIGDQWPSLPDAVWLVPAMALSESTGETAATDLGVPGVWLGSLRPQSRVAPVLAID